MVNNICAWAKKTIAYKKKAFTGGFIHKRHDENQGIIAQAMMRGTTYDVCIEPLQELTGEELSGSANNDNEARLDIKACGFWNADEIAFFYVRIFTPFAKSYLR